MKNVFIALSMLTFSAAILYACNRNSPLEDNKRNRNGGGGAHSGLYADSNTVKGLWVGTYTHSTGSDHYMVAIKPNDSAVVHTRFNGQAFYALGTWEIINDSLKVKYTYPADSHGNQLRQLFTAVYNGSDLMYGYWANTDVNWVPIYNPANTGTLQITEIH